MAHGKAKFREQKWREGAGFMKGQVGWAVTV